MRRVVTSGTRGWSGVGRGARGNQSSCTRTRLGWGEETRGEVEFKFYELGRGNQELNSANAAGRVGEFNLLPSETQSNSLSTRMLGRQGEGAVLVGEESRSAGRWHEMEGAGSIPTRRREECGRDGGGRQRAEVRNQPKRLVLDG